MRFKYELTEEIVKFIIDSLEKVTFQGSKEAQGIVASIGLLRNPLNKEEIIEERKRIDEEKQKSNHSKE